MNAPPSAPRRMVSSPSSSSDRYASRTETRLVRYRCAMSRSAGSFSPGSSAPSEICFLIRRAIVSETRPDRRGRAVCMCGGCYHPRPMAAPAADRSREKVVESRVAPASAAKTAASAAAALAFWFLPLDLDPRVQHALAIALFMVVAWITHAIDHALAGLAGCYLFWALNIAPFPLAFAGFADSTPWFLMGAVFFGVMATKSGLARRLAYSVLRAVGPSYARLRFGLLVAAFLPTFP